MQTIVTTKRINNQTLEVFYLGDFVGRVVDTDGGLMACPAAPSGLCRRAPMYSTEVAIRMLIDSRHAR